MGYEDRDWYREDYARKNGMRYDRVRGVYYVPNLRASIKRASAQFSAWHWSLQVALFLALCLLVFGVLRAINAFL